MRYYEYEVNVGSGVGTGEVIVDDDATDDQIRLAIMDDLYEVTYRPVQQPVSEADWTKAIRHLEMLIVEYASIGWAGRFGLDGVLVPLRKRYESGERTRELYDAIMETE